MIEYDRLVGDLGFRINTKANRITRAIKDTNESMAKIVISFACV